MHIFKNILGKGLCYFYEEKWHQGYKCTKPRLYLLEGMELPDHNVTKPEVELEEAVAFMERTIDDSIDITSISLHAIVGVPSPKTMCVMGQLKNKWVLFLIDTGSNHNFCGYINYF